MSGYEKCKCGFWTLEPQELWHDEPRKYGVVRHNRDSPCWATPNDPPESPVMVDWTWRSRAVLAEEEVERLTASIQRVREVCDRTRGDTWDSYNQGYNDALDVVESALEGDSDDE